MTCGVLLAWCLQLGKMAWMFIWLATGTVHPLSEVRIVFVRSACTLGSKSVQCLDSCYTNAHQLSQIQCTLDGAERAAQTSNLCHF